MAESKSAKLWNEDSASMFQDQMQDKIKEMIGDTDFENRQINTFVEDIVDQAQALLKSFKKPKFKIHFLSF